MNVFKWKVKKERATGKEEIPVYHWQSLLIVVMLELDPNFLS